MAWSAGEADPFDVFVDRQSDQRIAFPILPVGALKAAEAAEAEEADEADEADVGIQAVCAVPLQTSQRFTQDDCNVQDVLGTRSKFQKRKVPELVCEAGMKKKQRNPTDPEKLRRVPWRHCDSECNERMRAAVWLYRFMPHVPSKLVQQTFGISVKTLMRYVVASCQEQFQTFKLYFGPAGQGVGGLSDRALPKGQRICNKFNAEALWNDKGVPDAALRARVRLNQEKENHKQRQKQKKQMQAT